MKTKKLFLMLILLVWATTLPAANITQEQADVIVQDYLKNEAIQSGLLYVNANAPSEAGIAITTSQGETVYAKYACWVYYLNESESSPSHYLFVKEDTGNLLEVIANNDSGPNDLVLWKVVKDIAGLTEMENNTKLLYPNPVDDWLTLPCNGENIRVEIYDLKGTCLFSGMLSAENTCQLNVSFLNTGTYMVNISGKIFKIIKK